jgi:LiaI-LiaF-like transmembrane region
MFSLKSNKLKWGITLIAIGSIVWAHNFGLLSFSFNFTRDWPVILIAFGLLAVGKSVSLANHSAKVSSKGNKRAMGDILKDIESGAKTAEDAIKEMDSQK